ncbi:MAG: efflux transporter outer membrane subunit [Pseudomonadota bacterium]|nr:efflux transporter outer membrane subunit [Pseudomonadota bacterium]
MMRIPLRPNSALAQLLVLAPLLGSCSPGPDFVAPAPPAPSSGYANTGSPRVDLRVEMGGGPQGRWWEGFGSRDLDALVERALVNNQTLAASDATLEQARQQIAAVVGRRLPQVDANARIEHEEINLAAFGFNPATFGSSVAISNPHFNLYTVGGGVSYDLDLFHRNARALEQARAEGEAQRQQSAAAHLTIAGRVAAQVLMIAVIRDHIAAMQGLVDDSARNLALTRTRQQLGSGTLVEVLTAQAQLAEDQSQLPALDQQLAEARDMLAILVGISPAELGPTSFSLAQFTLPAKIPVALPSALVHQRPDILIAEARLHAATAAVGVAAANMYPDITLGGTYAQAANTIGSLLSNQFRGFDVFAGLTAPIFHGGTLTAQKRGAEASARAAAATYRETVLEAFQQVSDLLSSIDTDQRTLAATRESVAISGHSLDLSRRSFQIGYSGVLQVLTANQTHERAQLALIDAQGKQILNVARLYVATAGGWLPTGE